MEYMSHRRKPNNKLLNTQINKINSNLMVDLKHTKEIISVLGEIENTEEGIPE
jgi:hypothetical protein